MYSLFDIFVIGLGPSSSHTVGPMEAARSFAEGLAARSCLDRVACVQVELMGSLALTGAGHGTDRAIVLGLSGEAPDEVEPDAAARLWQRATSGGRLDLLGSRPIAFDSKSDILFAIDKRHPQHSNALRLVAFDAEGAVIEEGTYLSIGGGTVIREGEDAAAVIGSNRPAPRFAYGTAAELIEIAETERCSVADIVLANESHWRGEAEVRAYVDRITEAMLACIDRGLGERGILPGGLNVPRRAAELHEKLKADRGSNLAPPHAVLDWISLYAIGVNEENAAGGRVVRAPTNGAAGTVPAVLKYYLEHCPGGDRAGAIPFLLTATAVGDLAKRNASISGAEVGCQGEVGVASAMAAAGLAAVLGGSNGQIENAAEIALEHHLGMTCDPVGGLVQIPCIERNAMGAVKAINAASIALKGSGAHHVSLDTAIETMRQTGRDMSERYKETSLGGLAVNLIEC